MRLMSKHAVLIILSVLSSTFLIGCGGSPVDAVPGISSGGAMNADGAAIGTSVVSVVGEASKTVAPTLVAPTAKSLIDVSLWNDKDVVIPKGATVTLDASVTPKTVTVYGRLLCASDRDLSISAKAIVVIGGLFECGTEAAPHIKNLTITLYGNPSDESVSMLGTKVLGATDGGQVNLIGKARTNWVHLNANVLPGSSSLQLSQAVDWQPGDRIVIASSVIEDQSEERIVESVLGSIVHLTKPLSFAHTGETRQVAGTAIDLRAEVGLLSHSIVIQGDETSIETQFGGHVMIAHAGSNARIQGVQFTRMGQFNRLGRYPMHWHLVRDASTGYFKKNSISHSIQRGVIVHGTDNLLIEGNVVFDTPGHSYGTENGTEKGNVFSRNLGLGTRNAKLPKVVFEGSTTPADDDQAATFWMVGGDNTLIGNVAAGSESSGFWFDRSNDVRNFTGNVTHSSRSSGRPGDNEQAGISTKSSVGMTALLQDTVFHSNAVGAWLESDKIFLKNAKFVDNRMAAFSTINVGNAIVVGNSLGKPSNHEGFVTYKNRVAAKNVTFANFDAYALRTLIPGPEGASFRTEGLQFVNVADNRRILLHANGGDSYAIDLDGTLVGKPAVLTPEEPSMYTSDCVAKPSWNVRVCPPVVLPYQTAFVGDPSKGDTLTRGDGAQQTLSSRTPVFNVIAGQKYTMNRDIGNFSVWTAGAAGFIELIVPAAPGQFDIFECVRVDTCVDESRKLSPVATQAQLDQSNGDRYFYDAALGQLHLRVAPNRRVVVKTSTTLTVKAQQTLVANVVRANKLGRTVQLSVQPVLAKLPELRDRFGNVIKQDFCITPTPKVLPVSVTVASLS
jgi:uncharacterized Zn-binding protein involved in type VI secretion